MIYNLKKNVEEAERELVSRSVKSTTAELLLLQWELKDKYKDKPQPERYGFYLCEILNNVSIPLEKYDLIAGRSVHRDLTDKEEELFQNYKSHKNKLVHTMLDNGHAVYSWDNVVQLGLPGLKERAEETLARTENEEQQTFMRGAILIYEAIEKYLLRYAEKARELGMTELAQVCKKAATQAPDDFYTALQLTFTITFVQCSYITKTPQ